MGSLRDHTSPLPGHIPLCGEGGQFLWVSQETEILERHYERSAPLLGER
jgi:hypothetical protein